MRAGQAVTCASCTPSGSWCAVPCCSGCVVRMLSLQIRACRVASVRGATTCRYERTRERNLSALDHSHIWRESLAGRRRAYAPAKRGENGRAPRVASTAWDVSSQGRHAAAVSIAFLRQGTHLATPHADPRPMAPRARIHMA